MSDPKASLRQAKLSPTAVRTLETVKKLLITQGATALPEGLVRSRFLSSAGNTSTTALIELACLALGVQMIGVMGSEDLAAPPAAPALEPLGITDRSDGLVPVDPTAPAVGPASTP